MTRVVWVAAPSVRVLTGCRFLLSMIRFWSDWERECLGRPAPLPLSQSCLPRRTAGAAAINPNRLKRPQHSPLKRADGPSLRRRRRRSPFPPLPPSLSQPSPSSSSSRRIHNRHKNGQHEHPDPGARAARQPVLHPPRVRSACLSHPLPRARLKGRPAVSHSLAPFAGEVWAAGEATRS